MEEKQPMQGNYPIQQGANMQQYMPVGGPQPLPPNYTPGQAYPGVVGPPPAYQYGQVVVQQPVPGYNVVHGPVPQDHMTSAILVTLCCFWPTGIIAILRANESRVALARGDMVGAQTAAESARSMIKISVIIGIIAIVAATVLMGLYIGIILSTIDDDDHYDD